MKKNLVSVFNMKARITFMILICCLGSWHVSYSQTISTIVGTGGVGYSGDGGPASAATLDFTAGVLDNAGNLYIADGGNNVIRKVNSLGIISTVAGNGTAGYSGDGGPATAAALNLPMYVIVDATGNLYISDHLNNCIRMVNTSGIISTIAGIGTPGFSGDGGPATAAQLHYPVGLVFDGAGSLIIADDLNNRIRSINTGGVITTIAGTGAGAFGGDGGPATAAQL